MDKLSDADVDRLINGGASADNASSEQKAADDWLAAFAKRSQEALAKRDAEQKAALRPDDKVLIERLARKITPNTTGCEPTWRRHSGFASAR
jgi:hypothetical protein